VAVCAITNNAAPPNSSRAQDILCPLCHFNVAMKNLGWMVPNHLQVFQRVPDGSWHHGHGLPSLEPSAVVYGPLHCMTRVTTAFLIDLDIVFAEHTRGTIAFNRIVRQCCPSWSREKPDLIIKQVSLPPPASRTLSCPSVLPLLPSSIITNFCATTY